MNKILIALALIVGVAVAVVAVRKPQQTASPVAATSSSGGSTEVKIEGSVNTLETHQFLLKDEGRAVGTFSGDAFVTMLSLKTAEDLRDKYGDFFKCKEPGAVQAMSAIQASVLVGDSAELQKTISDAMALVRKGKVPVVNFQGGKLQVSKQEYNDMKVNDSTGIPIYYLNDFKIVTENFSTSK